MDELIAAHGRRGFASAWLHRSGLDWAADLMQCFPAV
jgi:hypothetical protein